MAKRVVLFAGAHASPNIADGNSSISKRIYSSSRGHFLTLAIHIIVAVANFGFMSFRIQHTDRLFKSIIFCLEATPRIDALRQAAGGIILVLNLTLRACLFDQLAA